MDFAARLKQAEAHLASKDAVLTPLISRHSPCTIRPHTDYYSELIRSIVGQQLSVKAGDAIWKRVQALFGGDVPTPEELIKIDTEVLRKAGLSYAKAAYMKDLAEHIIDGRLDMDHITSLPDDELQLQLTSVKGIGDWSAHMFMMFGLGRLDILPVGDLVIRKGVQSLYGLKELPRPAAIEEIATRNGWHPYCSVASWYVWKSLDNA